MSESNSQREHLTPYYTTVVYSDGQYFEAAVAGCCRSSQSIVMGANPDYDQLANVTEYMSPEVILFGEYLSREQIMKFFERGFQRVKIFLYSGEDGSKYADDDAVFDKRVTLFNLDSFYENVPVEQSLAASVILEKLMCLRFPDYACDTKLGLTSEAGEFLKKGILSTGQDFERVVRKVVSSWKGMEQEHELSLIGKILTQHAKKVVLARHSTAGVDIEFTHEEVPLTMRAVSAPEYINEVRSLLSEIKTADGANYHAVVGYRFERRSDNGLPVNGYLVSVGTTGYVNATRLLKQMLASETVIGDDKSASGWATNETVHKVLTFLA